MSEKQLQAEVEALSADLRLAMSYYICDNMLGLDYHGSDEDFARKPGGKVNAEMERWKRTLGVGELHRKHPKHDHCTFCNAQWPCEFADEVKP